MPSESSPNTGQLSLGLETCEASAPTTSPPATLSAAASRARTLATLAGGPGLRVSVAAYGASSPALLASYDPATCSWRTFQHSLDGGLTPFSATWPRSGLMRSGIAYRLPPLVPLTAGTDSSSWPTPTRQNATGNAYTYDRGDKTKPRLSLVGMARMWPTPRHSDAERGGRGDLVQAVRGNPNTHYKLWPTPNATDYKGASTRTPGKERSLCDDDLPTRVARESSGQLNPTWVEWLMGFPLGWTDLEDLETP